MTTAEKPVLEVPRVGDGLDGVRKALVVIENTPSEEIGMGRMCNWDGKPYCVLGHLIAYRNGGRVPDSLKRSDEAREFLMKEYGLRHDECRTLIEVNDTRYDPTDRWNDKYWRKRNLIDSLRLVLFRRLAGVNA